MRPQSSSRRRRANFFRWGLRESRNQKGIMLVSVLSILTVVSLMCVFFLSLLRFETRKDLLFLSQMKAKGLARSGLSFAIAKLKYSGGGVRDNFCDTRLEDWYYKEDLHSTNGLPIDLADADRTKTSYAGDSNLDISFGRGIKAEITLKVIDSASQINLNCSNPNLSKILSGLSDLDSTLATRIVNYRNSLPVAQPKFSFEEQIKNVTGVEAVFDKIKDFVTVDSWVDEKAMETYDLAERQASYSSRSPVNVNTAPKDVLKAVFLGYKGMSAGFASNLANRIVSHVKTTPFFSWQDFDDFIDTNTPGFGVSLRNAIKNGANPNRIKVLPSASGSYQSTELCFHGGGLFEVEVYVRVFRDSGQMLARERLKAFVDIYSLLQHTTKADFRDENTDNGNQSPSSSIGKGDWDGSHYIDNTSYSKVTWLDSCPVNEADDNNWQGYSGVDSKEISPFNYRTIPDSVKLGFWDDFDEDTSIKQSRAWWGNDRYRPIKMNDIGTHFSYKYKADDFTERDSLRLSQVLSYPYGMPPIAKRHASPVLDVVPGERAFHLDDADNELWCDRLQPDLNNVNAEYSKFLLGGLGSNNSSIVNSFKKWDLKDGFYLRCFNYDGPRTSIGTEWNFPGYLWSEDGVRDLSIHDGEGRGLGDCGRIELFSSRTQFYITPHANFYDNDSAEIKNGPAGSKKVFFVREGPYFYARCGSNTKEDKVNIKFQRDKVYKLFCDGSHIKYYAYAEYFDKNKHYHEHFCNPYYVGEVALYSNALQSAWDDIRVIDNSGRFAKHFVLEDSADFGSFHFNAFLPSGSEAFFAGDKDSSTGVVTAGVESVDVSGVSSSAETAFLADSGVAYPDVSYADLKSGARVIQGPDFDGKKSMNYSIRMDTVLNTLNVEVPVIDDVTVTYLPKTKLKYCFSDS